MEVSTKSTPYYLPGFEPEEIRPLINSFFSVVNKEFPDKIIIINEWNHQWDNAANMLCKKLGYSKGKDFLEAYGFSVVNDNPIQKIEYENYHQSSSISSSKKDNRVRFSEYTKEKTKSVKNTRKKRFSFQILSSVILVIVCIIYAIYFFKHTNNMGYNEEPLYFSSKEEMIDKVKGVFTLQSNSISSQLIITDTDVIHSVASFEDVVLNNSSLDSRNLNSDIAYNILEWNYLTKTIEATNGVYTYFSNDTIEFKNDVYIRDTKKAIKLSPDETIIYYNNVFPQINSFVELFSEAISFFQNNPKVMSVETIHMYEKKFIEQERLIQNDIDFFNIYVPNIYFNSSWNLYKEYLTGLIPAIKILQNWNPDNDGIYKEEVVASVFLEAKEILDRNNGFEFDKLVSACKDDEAIMRYETETAEKALKFTNIKIDHNSTYTVCTGIISNQGQHTYRFVSIKGGFSDFTGKVIDTDNTYAVGSEGLSPGESCTFRMSVPKNTDIKKCSISILDYVKE